jgi:hypothetical protein
MRCRRLARGFHFLCIGVSGKSVTPIADIYDATEMTSANTPSETLSVTPFGDPTWQRAELTTIGHQSQIFLGDRLFVRQEHDAVADRRRTDRETGEVALGR